MELTEEHRAKISASMKGRKQSAEHIAALSKVRKGKPATEAQRTALEKARAARTPESLAKQAVSLSASMKGRTRTPAQVAVLDAARAKAHAEMLGNTYGGFRGSFSEFGLALRERDGDLCQLCLAVIDFNLPVRSPMSRSVDHITPVRAGGSDDMTNLWLAHTVCNQRKGSRYVGRPDGSTDVRRDPKWS